jgi:DNA-binding CsgD family transcriptional regulator
MIRSDGTTLQFRHDLAQRAIRDGLDPADRVGLHRRALDLLSREQTIEPGELVRHAIAARDARQVLGWAPVAARRAAMLGAHRQAADHYASARSFVPAHDPRTRAELLEGEARERMIIDEVEVALQAQQEALTCWRELRDMRREGDGLRALSQMLWFSGATGQAADAAERAVDTLRALPAGPELARAYAAVAQRSMTSGRDDAAIEWGERALELAAAIDEEPVAVHALATIGVAQISAGNEAGWTTLESSLQRAVAAGLDEDAVRALINLLEAARDRRRYELADRYRDMAMRHLADHDLDFDLLRRRLAGDLAEVSLERGRWDEAAELAELLLSESRTARRIRVGALTTLGRLQARRGDRDAWALLDEALALAGPEADAEALIPLHTARVEAASLADDATRAGDEARLGLALVTDLERDPWQGGELGFWAWHAGAVDMLPADAAEPYALHAAGRHRDAAAAWEAIGCPYQAALALADSTDEVDQRRALETFLALGARPMARRMARRLRARGARGIRRGPRTVTRSNPAQLTQREIQVLSLVAEGHRNAEIAQRMVVSVKTVDHHVSSILRKLKVPTRAEAAVEAARLGLKDREPPPAR